MHGRSLVVALATCVLASPSIAAKMPASPYAGQQTRSIKALSDEDIDALRKGEGMGLAKAAELNGYPGPAHVRTLGKQLRLSEDQLRQIAAIFGRMSAAAKSLGAEMIDREQALDQLFVKGEITPDRLATATTAIGELNGRLRAVHLAARLETRALLGPQQLALYQQLRERRKQGTSSPPRLSVGAKCMRVTRAC
jgi:Spy/CpxP family protein refolding chaperone